MLATILLALLAVAIVPVVFQRVFIYYPRKYSEGAIRTAFNSGVSVVYFRASGAKQAAFFYRTTASYPSRLWILFGGNAMLALDWLDLLGEFPDRSTGFLLVDYPGYGLCSGRPTPARILETSEKAFRALQDQNGWNFGRESVGILGCSLGAAAGLQFAAQHPVARLILVSPFTTMNEIFKRFIGFNPGPLVLHRFDNIKALRRILAQEPAPKVTILHGRADTLIPVSMGQALAKVDPGQIRFVQIPDASHNDVLAVARSTVFADMVAPR